MTPLSIFTSAKLFPLAVSLTLKFPIVFSINFKTSPHILYILRQYTTQHCGAISVSFLSCHCELFSSIFVLGDDSLQVFHWGLSNIKSPLVSRTLLNILADLNTAIDWMFQLVFLFPSPFSKLLGTVLCLSDTIAITVTLMFHSFLSSLARSKYLDFISLF